VSTTVLQAEPVITRLRSAFNHGADRSRLLTLAAELIREAGEPYTSVYLYMLHGDDLVLEGFAGRETDHTRIPVGKGVCGTAVATGEDQNVGDVRGRENYIACNTFTRSELVVLIRRGSKILGQIDVDSDVLDPFTADEEREVRLVADALAALL
jgi:L-methionine (R)-S-oxide reductase